MITEARPSPVFWVFLLLIALVFVLLAFVPALLFVAQFLPAEHRLAGALVAAGLVPLLLLPKVMESIRTAHWKVDFEGLESPAIGRIRFSEVASVYRGYPREENLARKGFKAAMLPDVRQAMDEALVLRMADGRLVVLNLVSPSIHGGQAVMMRIQELLAGKPVVGFSPAEAKALKGRPANRIVIPRDA